MAVIIVEEVLKVDNNVALNMAAVTASNSFYVGGNWGFILYENEDFERISEILQNANSSVRVTDVSNGIIVFVNPNYLSSVINQVEPVDNETLMKQQTRVQTEVSEFQNYLMSILKGTCRYGRRSSNYEEYTFAVYSCNNTHKIRLNGIEYPAYSLTVIEALKQINQIIKYVDVYINIGNGFEDLRNIVAGNRMNDVNNGLEISGTLTGVFLTIRIVRK